MSDFSNALALSASGMQSQSMRLRHVSENIANTDTPGYHRKTTAFEQVVEGGRATGEVQLGPVRLDQAELTKIYDPGHPMADPNGYYDGSNVDLVVEIATRRTFACSIRRGKCRRPCSTFFAVDRGLPEWI